jgi:hypothetical protein
MENLACRLHRTENQQEVVWAEAPHLNLVGRDLEVMLKVAVDLRRGDQWTMPPTMVTKAC